MKTCVDKILVLHEESSLIFFMAPFSFIIMLNICLEYSRNDIHSKHRENASAPESPSAYCHSPLVFAAETVGCD